MEETNKNHNLITTKEICQRLGRTRQAIQLMRTQDGMPHVKLGYRTVYYDWKDIVKWLKEKYGKNYENYRDSKRNTKKK
jgi:predicted DNA-binding transcriptional regulator AlpA